MAKRRKMIGLSLGDCVHVAGVLNFLDLAEQNGYEVVFSGAAKSPEEAAKIAAEQRADILAVGYRLDPDAARNLFRRLRDALVACRISPDLLFGGTPPVAQVAREEGMFLAVFSGLEDVDEIIAFLRGVSRAKGAAELPDNLVERMSRKAPYPVLRHHFGLPSLDETVRGIERIAESGVLDVLSLGPDQNAQESFFRPHEMDHDQDGAGGVPVRSASDLEALYRASRRGNYPLMRCYSGTRDVIRFAELLRVTIHNAWAAVPLCWYNVLDSRGPREVEESVAEAQRSMAWHAERGIPVEVNEAHHWSLRDAPDVVAVVASYLAAYNAMKAGVKDYVAQFMFNTPPGTTAAMDLGKMMAKLDLIRALEGRDFRVWREVRAGLASFPVDLDQARGQLATSTLVSMNLRPHIVHVVGYCEGQHIAHADEVIESCKIARGVIRNCLSGMPDMAQNRAVRKRRDKLVGDAWILLRAIEELHEIRRQEGATGSDPFTDPATLALAIRVGLLDAPHLRGNPSACGEVVTSIVDGACVAVDPVTRTPVSEEERVARILENPKRLSTLTKSGNWCRFATASSTGALTPDR